MLRFMTQAIAVFAASTLLGIADSGDLQFEASVASSTIKIPGTETSANTPVLLALRITNSSDKQILLNKFIPVLPQLRTSNGDLIKTGYGQDASYPIQGRDFVFLKPKRTMYILIDCTLYRSSNGTLHFSGGTPPGGFWLIENLPSKAAKYFLSLVYWSEDRDFPSEFANYYYGNTPWYGKVETKTIPLELIN